MIDAKIRGYLDLPLDNAKRASGVWLPEGRRTAPREVKREPSAEEKKQLAEYRSREASKQLSALFDYYATTTVPFDRIAVHTQQAIGTVREAMAKRGREA